MKCIKNWIYSNFFHKHLGPKTSHYCYLDSLLINDGQPFAIESREEGRPVG